MSRASIVFEEEHDEFRVSFFSAIGASMANVCEKRLSNDAEYFEARYMRGGLAMQSFDDEAYTCCQPPYL